jgi:peptidoglycan/LPS O-acetylase OafA/YrhL
MKFLAYLASPWTDIDKRRSSHGDSVSVLDGIRGLAVWIVLASHSGVLGLAGQGSVGVFMFFALSGFVLTLPFADQPARIFGIETWRYFTNRALRIVPAFVVAVLLLKWQLGKSFEWALLNLSFHSGWNHLWSVASEVRFYLLFPVVIAGLALCPSRAFRICALAGLIFLAWIFQSSHKIALLMPDGPFVTFYFYIFLTGMLACLIYRALDGRSLGYSIDVVAIIGVAALLCVNGWEHTEAWCCFFLFLLVSAAANEKAVASRLLRSRVMRHFGLLSYAIYLFQVPVRLWLLPLNLEGVELFATTFAGTYIVAIASYLLVEKPFLMLKPRRINRPTPLARPVS